MDAKYHADTSIADSSREYQMKKASFDIEVNARVCFTLKSNNFYVSKRPT